MKNRYKYTLLIIVLFFIGYFIAAQEENKSYKRTQIIMGTVVEIEIRNNEEAEALEAMNAAFAEIRRIDNLFTTYNADSPVSIINNSPDSIINVSEEIRFMLLESDSLYKITNGAFDISIGALIEAWGFEKENPEVPSDEIIDKALVNSGWMNIKIVDAGRIIKNKNIKLNFGAVAKGYAADRAVEVLSAKGIKEALVNIGGEINQLGNNWIVGIQHPRLPGAFVEQVNPGKMAIATSGDYEKYFEFNGIRYHHIINPMDGYPASECWSVSVIAPDALTADAIATGVFVLGVHEGLNLIEGMKSVEAFIVDSTGQKFFSSGFRNYLVAEE